MRKGKNFAHGTQTGGYNQLGTGINKKDEGRLRRLGKNPLKKGSFRSPFT
jgi:hypothetical protein